MSFFHCQFKVISRAQVNNIVKYLAQKTGTNLTNSLAGETFKYEKRPVEVYLLFPQEDNFPWIQDISEKLNTDKSAAVQNLSEKLEQTEKRIETRLYVENRAQSTSDETIILNILKQLKHELR